MENCLKFEVLVLFIDFSTEIVSRLKILILSIQKKLFADAVEN